MSDSIFAGIGGAQARLDANYEQPGHYWLLIRRVKTGISRKKEGYVAIEKTVIRVLDDDDGLGHKVGSDVTHMLMTKHDSFLGNIKAMIANVYGVPADTVEEDDAVEITGDEQPMAGLVVECKNRNTTTKAGGTFTVINYKRSIPVEELREELDEEALELYFPGDTLDRMEAAEQA